MAESIKAEELIKNLRAEVERLTRELSDCKTQFEFSTLNQVSLMPGALALRLHLQDLQSMEESMYPIAALVIDLNKFKEINDTFGHEVGDKALLHAGRYFLEAIRQGDKIFHLPGKQEVFHPHGDEFVIFLTRSSTTSAKAVADRIRNIPALKHHGKVIPLACSVGVHIASSVVELKSLLRKADRNMYADKKLSRV